MFSIRLLAVAAVVSVAAASPALASPCQGKVPVPGAKVSGTVIHVLDGQRLCVASGPSPELWVELQVTADLPTGADAQLSKLALMNASFAKPMSCVVESATPGSTPRARCTVDRQPVDDLLRRADPVEVAQWMSKPEQPTVLASAR